MVLGDPRQFWVTPNSSGGSQAVLKDPNPSCHPAFPLSSLFQEQTHLPSPCQAPEGAKAAEEGEEGPDAPWKTLGEGRGAKASGMEGIPAGRAIPGGTARLEGESCPWVWHFSIGMGSGNLHPEGWGCVRAGLQCAGDPWL